MEGVYLALRLAQCGWGGKAFADGLSVFLAGQAEVRTVTRLAGLMTVTIGFSATALDGGDGATAKVAELENLGQELGTLLLEGGEGIGQGAPPLCAYIYVRIIAPKKKTSKSSLLCRAPQGSSCLAYSIALSDMENWWSASRKNPDRLRKNPQVVEEGAGPDHGPLAPEIAKGFLQLPGAGRGQLARQQGLEFLPSPPAYAVAATQ